MTDFGLAQSLKNRERETSFRGSPLYMAPEILRRQSYDASVDLWSTGVILYECLFGKPPCSSKSLKELVERILSEAAIVVSVTVKLIVLYNLRLYTLSTFLLFKTQWILDSNIFGDII